MLVSGKHIGSAGTDLFHQLFVLTGAADAVQPPQAGENGLAETAKSMTAGESGVVGPDERKGAKICACEFPSIKGGKPFNVRKGSFRKMLSEIGQPKPRKKRTAK